MVDEKFQEEKRRAIAERMSKVRAAKEEKKIAQATPAPSVKNLEEENEFLRSELDAVNDGELSKSERRQIEEEVRREVRAAERKSKKDELRKKLKKKFEQERGLREGEEEIYLDLAKHSNCIMLDGVQYFHGRVYKVRTSVAAQMRETMQSGHYHQAEVDGKFKRYYTKRPGNINPAGGGGLTTTRSLVEV